MSNVELWPECFNDLMLAFLDLYALAKANNRDSRYDAFLQSVAGRFARSPRPTTPTTPTTPA